MTKKAYELAQFLSGHTPKAALFYGDNFMVEHYGNLLLESVKNAAQKSGKNLEIIKFYFEEFDAKKAHAMLSQNSLFGDVTALLVKCEKPIKDIKNLLSCLLQKGNENYLLIEVYDAKIDKDFKAMTREFGGEKFLETRFFAPNHSEAISIAQQVAEKLGLNIGVSELATLLESYNHNLGMALKELEKLRIMASPSAPITPADIQFLCDGVGGYEVDELVNCLLNRGEIAKILAAIEAQGASEREIINALGKFFYTQFLFCAYARMHGRIEPQDILGYKPPRQISDRFIAGVRRFREEKFIEIFDLINAWKVESKSSAGKELRTLNALYKIQGML